VFFAPSAYRVASLFKALFLVTRLYSIDDRMNDDELERI
jgi:hypothetical protein